MRYVLALFLFFTGCGTLRLHDLDSIHTGMTRRQVVSELGDPYKTGHQDDGREILWYRFADALDRIVIIKGGNVEEFGRPADLATRQTIHQYCGKHLKRYKNYEECWEEERDRRHEVAANKRARIQALASDPMPKLEAIPAFELPGKPGTICRRVPGVRPMNLRCEAL